MPAIVTVPAAAAAEILTKFRRLMPMLLKRWPRIRSWSSIRFPTDVSLSRSPVGTVEPIEYRTRRYRPAFLVPTLAPRTLLSLGRPEKSCQSIPIPLRIERIAQSITEERESEHRQTDSQDGEHEHVGIRRDVSRLASISNHLPPACLGRTDANADKTQSCLCENRGRNA